MTLEMAPSADVSISAFLLLHGHCFRMIKSDTCLTIHCDEPVAMEGSLARRQRRSRTVEACAKHRPNEEP